MLLGNSGGGSLFAFYLEQAAKPPAERLRARAVGRRRAARTRPSCPPADGLVLLAAHLGEGRFLLDRLDPSVVDEADPVATDPRLDMYDPRNGYRPMSDGPSSYAAGLPRRVPCRAARALRSASMRARSSGARRRAGIGAGWASAGVAADRPSARVSRATRSSGRYFLIYRTLADPRYLDPTLDPSQRPLGSIFSFGRDPIVGNYGEGLARTMSARGWLSTWSGLASNAALERTLPGVTVPTLVVCALADMDIYPSECRRASSVGGATDKQWAELALGRPLPLPGRSRGRRAPASAGPGRGRDHPAVAAPALAALAGGIEPD